MGKKKKRKEKEKSPILPQMLCPCSTVPQSSCLGNLVAKTPVLRARSSTRDTQHETAPGTLFHIQSKSQTHTPPFACACFYYSFFTFIFFFNYLLFRFLLLACCLLITCYRLRGSRSGSYLGDGRRLVGLGLMGFHVACPHFTRTYGCPGNWEPFFTLVFGRLPVCVLLLLLLLLLSACYSSTRQVQYTVQYLAPVLQLTKPSLKFSWCFDAIHTFLLYPPQLIGTGS